MMFVSLYSPRVAHKFYTFPTKNKPKQNKLKSSFYASSTTVSTLPGLRILLGSIAFLICNILRISDSERAPASAWRFYWPIPCSAEMLPVGVVNNQNKIVSENNMTKGGESSMESVR